MADTKTQCPKCLQRALRVIYVSWGATQRDVYSRCVECREWEHKNQTRSPGDLWASVRPVPPPTEKDRYDHAAMAMGVVCTLVLLTMVSWAATLFLPFLFC